MVAVGDRYEAVTIRNLTRTVDLGSRFGIPTLGVTAIGKDMARDARYLSLASRVCAENGAHVVKTYFCEGFEQVAATCPVPIVLAGGKKLPELDALTMAYKAIDQGASGVDMGRNIFQAGDPIAMIQVVKAVVHDNETPDKAFDLYNTLKQES
jgi:putative autoinducer-2 (AI-2) aldolase